MIQVSGCKRLSLKRGLASDIYDQWVVGSQDSKFSLEDFSFEKKPKDYQSLDSSGLKLQDGSRLNKKELQKIQRNFKAREQKSSGGWGGTGGSGVVCFNNSTTADKAVDKNGILREEYYDDIKKISLLDYYEAPDRDVFFPVKVGESVIDYLNRMLNHLEPLAPYFTFQLKIALKMLLSESWIDNALLPFVPDTGEGLELNDRRCKRVQIAIRFSKEKECDYPKVFLEVNHRLLEKVSELNDERTAVLNQAMFLLHEATYLLAVEIGHKNSKDIRNFVRFFLDEKGFQFRKKLNSFSGVQNQAESFLYGFRFFNFLSYRGLFLKNSDVTSYSQQSRRRSYAFTRKMLELIPEDLARKKDTPKDFDGFMTRVLEERQAYEEEYFTNEDAFLMKSFAYFQQGQIDKHFDYLLIGDDEDDILVRQICKKMESEALGPFIGERPKVLWDYWASKGIEKTKRQLIDEAYRFDRVMQNESSYVSSMKNTLKAVTYCSHFISISDEKREVLDELKEKYWPLSYPFEKRLKEFQCQ